MRCVFCNNTLAEYHKSKKVTAEEIDNEHYFRNMNQEKYSIHEINFLPSEAKEAHKNCYPNVRNWHKNNCQLFEKGDKKCNCGCGVVPVKRKDSWSISEFDKKYIKKEKIKKN